jgi:hypothetical protein
MGPKIAANLGLGERNPGLAGYGGVRVMSPPEHEGPIIMAKRGDSRPEAESNNNWIRQHTMPDLAKKLDIPELPMHHEGFDFYGAAVAFFIKNSEIRGDDLHVLAARVFDKILTKNRAGKTPVEDYIRRYRLQEAEGRPIQPFDRYFNMFINDKRKGLGWKVLRDFSRQQQKHRAVPIGQGRTEWPGEESVTEESLPSRELSPEKEFWFREENPKKERVMSVEIPERLREHRNGQGYVEIWDLMRDAEKKGEKYTDQQIANFLNSMQIPPPGKEETAPGVGMGEGAVPGTEEGEEAEVPGEIREWTRGAVARSRTIIVKEARKVMREYRVDEESILMASRKKGFRFGPAFRG